MGNYQITVKPYDEWTIKHYRMHKKDNLARPIVSMMGASEYNLAKFLDSTTRPYVIWTYMIDSLNEMIEKLQEFNFNQKLHLASFDVTSLLTNVPPRETNRQHNTENILGQNSLATN